MQKLKFGIEKPCTEHWDAMTPNQTGRFCHHCTQDVIDFSEKTDEEILNFFTNRKNHASICARMTEQQLEKGIVLSPVRFSFPNFVRKLAAATLIGCTLAGTPVLVNGQSVVEGVQSDTTKPQVIDHIITIEVPATYQDIKVQRVKTPAKIIVHEVPAEYETIQRRKLVKKGGVSLGWREIACVAPEGEITVEIKRLKEKLKEKGYYEGEIDNVLNDEVQWALINFKRDNKLIPAFELDDDTMYLLGMD